MKTLAPAITRAVFSRLFPNHILKSNLGISRIIGRIGVVRGGFVAVPVGSSLSFLDNRSWLGFVTTGNRVFCEIEGQVCLAYCRARLGIGRNLEKDFLLIDKYNITG